MNTATTGGRNWKAGREAKELHPSGARSLPLLEALCLERHRLLSRALHLQLDMPPGNAAGEAGMAVYTDGRAAADRADGHASLLHDDRQR